MRPVLLNRLVFHLGIPPEWSTLWFVRLAPRTAVVHEATKHGALISYACPFDASIQEPVAYIDRILRRTSTGEPAVQAPNKYQLSIKLKTAKALGLYISSTLLATADEVIE